MLEAKNIEFSYLNSLPLFKGISMNFERNEVVGIIGPSGCGKSTFSKILAGYVKPSKGEVIFQGKPLPQRGYCSIQLIYQHPENAVNPKWKMKQVLEEGSKEIDMEFLDKMGIKKEWLDRWPSELSGGELQRFCIARALASNPQYIIADEMTTMLDAITQAAIWKMMLEEVHKRGIGLLVITHNYALASRICDRIIDFEKLLSESGN